MCGVIMGGLFFLLISIFGVATVDQTSGDVSAAPDVIVGPGAVSVNIVGAPDQLVEVTAHLVSGIEARYYLVRQSAQTDVMDAELTGTLTLEDGCFYIDTDSERYLVIWPMGYLLSFERLYPAENPVILDANEERIAGVGEMVYVSGGEIPASAQADFEAENSATLPIAECEGLYWLAGSEARPIQ